LLEEGQISAVPVVKQDLEVAEEFVGFFVD